MINLKVMISIINATIKIDENFIIFTKIKTIQNVIIV